MGIISLLPAMGMLCLCVGTMSVDAVVLTARTGEVTSPNYPDSYPHNTMKTYIIFGGPGTTIKLSFTNVSIEFHRTCDFDNLKVYNSTTLSRENLMATICGHGLPDPVTFESYGGAMVLDFESDDSISGRGFRAEYSILDTVSDDAVNKRDISRLPKCGPNQKDPHGVITSPGYPNFYPPNSLCAWTIRGPAGSTVQLTFTNVSMEMHPLCIYDSVTIYETARVSEATQIARLCGDAVLSEPLTYSSNGRRAMVVVFKSDLSMAGQGFRAEYTIQGSPSDGETDSPTAPAKPPQPT